MSTWVTLARQELVDWITMGEGIDGGTVEKEIERYRSTLEKILGTGWTVQVAPVAVPGTQINGMPPACADEDIREALADAEAYVVNRFWFDFLTVSTVEI